MQELVTQNMGKSVNGSCVRSAMLYDSKCMAPRKTEMVRLEENERAMLRWMCSLKLIISRLPFSVCSFGSSAIIMLDLCHQKT